MRRSSSVLFVLMFFVIAKRTNGIFIFDLLPWYQQQLVRVDITLKLNWFIVKINCSTTWQFGLPETYPCQTYRVPVLAQKQRSDICLNKFQSATRTLQFSTWYPFLVACQFIISKFQRKLRDLIWTTSRDALLFSLRAL